MLRLQMGTESGAFVRQNADISTITARTALRLAYAKDGAVVMHPGPMETAAPRRRDSSNIALTTRSVSLITQASLLPVSRPHGRASRALLKGIVRRASDEGVLTLTDDFASWIREQCRGTRVGHVL